MSIRGKGEYAKNDHGIHAMVGILYRCGDRRNQKNPAGGMSGKGYVHFYFRLALIRRLDRAYAFQQHSVDGHFEAMLVRQRQHRAGEQRYFA